MRVTRTIAGAAAVILTLGITGCGSTNEGYHEVPKGTKVKEEAHDHEHGPHGGHLVELGNEEYHAEVTFDAKANKIVVYLLDSTAKKPAPTDSKDVALKLTVGGKPQSFSATAAPQEGDPKGNSSRFELAGNPDIKANVKDEEDLKGSVNVTIGGKPYSGEIEHHHEH